MALGADPNYPNLRMYCLGDDPDWACNWSKASAPYVVNADDIYFSTDDARINYLLSKTGRLAQGELTSAAITMATGDIGVAAGAWVQSLGTMQVAITNGHVMYGVDDSWLHGTLYDPDFPITAQPIIGGQAAVENTNAYIVPLPVLFPDEVLSTEGEAFDSCLDAAVCGFLRGWGK